MNTHDFSHLYSILNLPFDADEVMLRQQYKRLAQRYHPDAREGDAERFVAIQQAHAALQEYLRDHGRLPLIYSMPCEDPGGVRRQPRTKKATGTWQRRRRWIFAGALIATLLYVVWPDGVRQAPAEASRTRTASAPTQAATGVGPDMAMKPTFTMGSPMSEVLDAQGVPEEGDTTVWRYGHSTVHFHDGRVMGWKEHPDSPLNLRR